MPHSAATSHLSRPQPTLIAIGVRDRTVPTVLSEDLHNRIEGRAESGIANSK